MTQPNEIKRKKRGKTVRYDINYDTLKLPINSNPIDDAISRWFLGSGSEDKLKQLVNKVAIPRSQAIEKKIVLEKLRSFARRTEIGYTKYYLIKLKDFEDLEQELLASEDKPQ